MAPLPTFSMARFQRFISRTSDWLTKVTIIIGICHFFCFSTYICYLTVTPTLCYLDKNCRNFPEDVSYADFLISVPGVPAVKIYKFLTKQSSRKFDISELRSRGAYIMFASAKAAHAGFVIIVTESLWMTTPAPAEMKHQQVPQTVDEAEVIVVDTKRKRLPFTGEMMPLLESYVEKISPGKSLEEPLQATAIDKNGPLTKQQAPKQRLVTFEGQDRRLGLL